ncbi:uncharacterized protein ZBAI_03462 [Zygosaccharomyces bailii ISA1307]|nr:uncharacterized protein ZBAI_03462 [Zygosaccharomyces bailii ISA1307]
MSGSEKVDQVPENTSKRLSARRSQALDLDSIMVGIEEYLNSDDPERTAEVPVNIVKGEEEVQSSENVIDLTGEEETNAASAQSSQAEGQTTVVTGETSNFSGETPLASAEGDYPNEVIDVDAPGADDSKIYELEAEAFKESASKDGEPEDAEVYALESNKVADTVERDAAEADPSEMNAPEDGKSGEALEDGKSGEALEDDKSEEGKSTPDMDQPQEAPAADKSDEAAGKNKPGEALEAEQSGEAFAASTSEGAPETDRPEQTPEEGNSEETLGTNISEEFPKTTKSEEALDTNKTTETPETIKSEEALDTDKLEQSPEAARLQETAAVESPKEHKVEEEAPQGDTSEEATSQSNKPREETPGAAATYVPELEESSGVDVSEAPELSGDPSGPDVPKENVSEKRILQSGTLANRDVNGIIDDEEHGNLPEGDVSPEFGETSSPERAADEAREEDVLAESLPEGKSSQTPNDTSKEPFKEKPEEKPEEPEGLEKKTEETPGQHIEEETLEKSEDYPEENPEENVEESTREPPAALKPEIVEAASLQKTVDSAAVAHYVAMDKSATELAQEEIVSKDVSSADNLVKENVTTEETSSRLKDATPAEPVPKKMAPEETSEEFSRRNDTTPGSGAEEHATEDLVPDISVATTVLVAEPNAGTADSEPLNSVVNAESSACGDGSVLKTAIDSSSQPAASEDPQQSTQGAPNDPIQLDGTQPGDEPSVETPASPFCATGLSSTAENLPATMGDGSRKPLSETESELAQVATKGPDEHPSVSSKDGSRDRPVLDDEIEALLGEIGETELELLEAERRKQPIYIYTSLAGGGFHMVPRTNRLTTILTANRISFTYRDLGTDQEARTVWKTHAKGKQLPGVVRGTDVIGNWQDVEDANEEYSLENLLYS